MAVLTIEDITGMISVVVFLHLAQNKTPDRMPPVVRGKWYCVATRRLSTGDAELT